MPEESFNEVRATRQVGRPILREPLGSAVIAYPLGFFAALWADTQDQKKSFRAVKA